MTKNRVSRLLSVLLALTSLWGFACAHAEQAPLRVVTTTAMIADMVTGIGGERVEVRALMGSGVDPHVYRVSFGDIQRLNGAELIVYNGLHLEGRMGQVLERMARKRPVHALGEALPAARLIAVDDAGAHDPHIWFDLRLWREAGEALLERLIALRPEDASLFRTRAAAYFARLDALDARIRQDIASLPENQRLLVTAHDAFAYFGRAYGMEVVGLQGISTASEFGLADLRRVRQIVASRGVKAVFIESSVPPRFIESLLAGLESAGQPVRLGGELFSDSMGPAGTPEGQYFGMVEHNLHTILEALQ
ncbi:MAG: zinc ABC transporter substrate-binding protein [Halothiobacillaceae bacterium]|jgi:manganese/zinc/iron transport system substrate-binding protein|nr:zinc ABC transporter substrate-binding protein [Halothiobacillaceae bacterium]MDY0049341.1 zinc ABC transporter substrate-binding protein [Halothiobacillaceae bacterium]